jgi:hypothetical protein
MKLEAIILAFSGWVVTVLVVVIHLRNKKRFLEQQDRLKRLAAHLIEATERQKEPLNRLVALGQPGSELRDEAVTALRIAETAAAEVIRAEPGLKPDSSTSSPQRVPPDR